MTPVQAAAPTVVAPATTPVIDNKYKALSATKGYLNDIGSAECSFASVAAKISLVAFPVIVLLTLIYDMLAAIYNCLYGAKEVAVVAPAPTPALPVPSAATTQPSGPNGGTAPTQPTTIDTAALDELPGADAVDEVAAIDPRTELARAAAKAAIARLRNIEANAIALAEANYQADLDEEAVISRAAAREAGLNAAPGLLSGVAIEAARAGKVKAAAVAAAIEAAPEAAARRAQFLAQIQAGIQEQAPVDDAQSVASSADQEEQAALNDDAASQASSVASVHYVAPEGQAFVHNDVQRNYRYDAEGNKVAK